jgi:hypothetical protein
MSLEKNARFMVTSDEDLDGQDDSDDDPMMDDDGYTEMTPSFDEDEMLEALEEPSPTDTQAELDPQEAYETMLFQAPLSKNEAEVIDSTPMLYDDPHNDRGHPIRWVDDPDHNEWIMQRMKERYKAMDEVLEDQMYGAGDPFGTRSLTEEERVERAGSDIGLRAPKFVRRVARGLKKGFNAVARGFNKGRDTKKAELVKKLYKKLVFEHANYLQAQDVRRGARKPRAFYDNVSKQWARNKIQQAGLPTSFTAGTETASQIMGDSTMGSWWNPFSWFEKKTKYVLLNTRGERMAEMTETEYQAYAGTRAAQMVSEQQQQAQAEQQPAQAEQEPHPEQYEEPSAPAPDGEESASGW